MTVQKPIGQFLDKLQTRTGRERPIRVSCPEEGCPKTLLLRLFGQDTCPKVGRLKARHGISGAFEELSR